MDYHSNAADHLVWILIPADTKARLRRVLNRLGITNDYLFPDLNHLADEIFRTGRV